ncbi:MAG: DUF1833 domain-containing protein [Cellvibrionaceae bacterium]|nr:DUF1833 domain-containing protein [Cellvibrionaceae bacterium]
MPTLDELYASAPVDDMIYTTLRFLHSAFSQEHRLILANTPVMLGLALEQPLLEFTPVSGEVTPPTLDVGGRQDWQITLDGVSLQVAEELDLVSEAPREKVSVVFAYYIASEPGQPAQVFEATLKNPRITETRFTANAVFTAPEHIQYPRRLFTTLSHPGLA